MEGSGVPVLDEPVATVSQRNLIQQHEIGYDDDGEGMRGCSPRPVSPSCDGTMMMLIDEVIPT
jgi:hypothetical protein